MVEQGQEEEVIIILQPYRKDLTEHYNENGRGARDSDGFINFDAVVNHNVANTSGYTGDIGRGVMLEKKLDLTLTEMMG